MGNRSLDEDRDEESASLLRMRAKPNRPVSAQFSLIPERRGISGLDKAYSLELPPLTLPSVQLFQLMITGGINLAGSIEPIHDAVTLVEMAVEKGAQPVLMPVASQIFDLSDDMSTKVDAQFYQDARDVLLKALVE